MKIYLYDEKTGEYLKESIAYLDLERSRELNARVYTMPDNATAIEPPICKQDEKCLFIDESWQIVPDFRGKRFFDTSLKKTVTITKLGILPTHYKTLDSKEFQDYLKKTDIATISNNIKRTISQLYDNALGLDILLGKYYFTLNQYEIFTKLKQEEETRREKLIAQIKGLQKKIKSLKKETNTEIAEYNEYAEKQLALYKELDNAIITIDAKNKRIKQVQIPCKYEEFLVIYDELTNYKKQLDDEVDKLILDLNLCRKEDLPDFEANLNRKGLNFGKTINETSAKRNSTTS